MKALLTLMAVLAPMTAASLSGAASAAQADAPAAAVPATAQVLRNVRAAVGQERLGSFGQAFEITESDEARTFRIQFGTRGGKLRNEREFLYDGRLGWQFDSRRDMFVPASLRQREKAAWPLWVRGHWWLDPNSGVQARVLPEQSDSREIALALSLPGGVAGATVYVDRLTWLPDRIVVPYERGPFTQRYRDYRNVAGVRFPFAVETSYRDKSSRNVVSVRPLAPASLFDRPRPPLDYRFDRARPAALATRQGAPFPSGTPGHVYVRAVADDRREGWWHLDSGADTSIIDESVAEALGMEVIGTHRSAGADGKPVEGTWRRARSLAVGRIRIENPVFRAMDLGASNAPPGERRMGTLGYDLFARAVVEWGEGGRRVRICDPAAYRLPRGARWQRLEHIDATPAFPGVAEGLAGLFQIDTGNSGTVDFARPFHERNAMLRDRPTRKVQVLGSGGSFAVEVGRLADFKFAGQDYRDLEVAFRTGGVSREGSAGTIGRDVLERFTLAFDYPNQRLAFLPAGRSGVCN
ncbi:MAG TPA: retropepsin-like aspartic protease [Allosphingosinicella sp.]|nr:retropepsin-like aspartic protease [Allosphingosinicella sp.]